MGVTNNILAYDFDMAVSLFGLIIENRLDEKVEIKNGKGQVIGYKLKYTLKEALCLKPSQRNVIQTTEEAIAAGFIPMSSDGKPKHKAG